MTVLENLTPNQHTRQALQRAIHRIAISWPQALEDANARGYPAGSGYGGDRSDGQGASILVDGERVRATYVEVVALEPSEAVAWLAELGDVLERYGVAKFTVSQDRMISIMLWKIENELNTLPEHTIKLTIRLANSACQLWPPPAKPGDQRIKPYDSETCLVCQVDAYPGDRRAMKRPDGTVEGYVHKTPCWYTININRGTHPRQTKTS